MIQELNNSIDYIISNYNSFGTVDPYSIINIQTKLANDKNN